LEEPSRRIADLIRSIPPGRVASYGQIAALAGIPHGARQVARLLHSSSDKRGLPWHRVLNAQGRISLPRGGGAELQRRMLKSEGVTFRRGVVDRERFGWRPVLGGEPDAPVRK
jgi:methylated-DNA-protein-cysteine methyltransferase related protein